MKSSTRPLIACCAAAFSLLAPFLRAAPEIATQLDLSSETTPAARKFYFETIPGQRYSLWRSTNMLTWEEVSGFPKVADGMSLEHTFAQQDKEFFSIQPIDEQAPTIVSQFPAVDGFAVGRFADLSIVLADATGIDPASIRLTVGASGQMAPGAPGLTISGNTITYDSGDAALGAWGATISATLVAADTLGHTLTHTWSFRLEPEPQVAANIFVFGSPTAQRAGQRVSGPAAALAARFPAPAGPQKAVEPPPWHIESVLADRVVIAYEAGGSPSFTAGHLICNLAPTNETEIFYRSVVSTNNDVANSKLTVFTEEATLTDFVSQGSSTFNENSVVYEVDEIGGIVSAVGEPLSLSKKTINLSGSSYKLRSDGYQATLAGIGTYSSGSAEPWLEVSLPEYQWSFQPTIKSEFEIGWSGLTFETIISGTNSLSTVLDAKVLLTGASTTTTLYDLPPEKEPFKLIYFGQLGPVPVWAVLKFDISIKSKAEAAAILEFSATYRQAHQVNALGFSKKPASDWRFYRNVQSDSPDLRGSAALTGQFSLEIITDPRIEFLVYGLAGMKAGFEGKVGIETNASYGTGGGVLGGKLTAGVDCFVGTSGPFLDLLGIDEQLSWKWWEGEWPLTPQVLAFKTHPQSRTVATGDDVSFTCTVDSPTPPLFQWYQNGRLLPGQTSRSLFLPFVNSGHAGSYSVTAKAGSLSATSNTAILTVQTTTPENLDADGDGIPNLHETNTGTWVSTTSRGTNPNHWDSDGDGLSDGVETNTRVYVSRSNTGTNPLSPDTDADGVNDKREIELGTDPNAAPGLPGGPIPLSGPSHVGWRSLGANYDFTNDQQTGDPASDIVGNATNPGFFTAFDNNGTPLLTDGNLGFRVRLDAQSNTVDFGRNLWIGIDADLSGTIDVFLGLNMQDGTSSAEIGIFPPGSGLNISPNTTTVSSTSYTNPNVSPSAANYNYRPVDFTTDGGTSNDIGATGSGTKAEPDYYVSVLFPFADIVSFLGTKTNPISINQNSSIRYVLGTSTQPNSFNQDLGGINGQVSSDLTWEDLGGFTPVTTPNGIAP